MKAVVLTLLLLSLTTALRHEAESGHFIGGASHKRSDNANNGVVELSDPQHRLILTVHSQTDEPHVALFRYSAKDGARIALKVNGHEHLDTVFPLSLGPSSHKVNIDLRRGINTVVLDHISGVLHLDYLEVPRAVALAGRGATLSYTEQEAEDAKYQGTLIGPDRTYQKLPSEASGRKAVQITGDQYVQFNSSKEFNAIAVRFSIPDTADGSGQFADLEIRIGSFSTKLGISSKFSWAYGSYPFTKRPSDGGAHHFYDESRKLLGKSFPAGTNVIVKGATAGITYTIDLANFYNAPAAYKMPSGGKYVSVVDYGADATGAKDSTDSIQKAITDAQSKGKYVWIPVGNFLVHSRFALNKMTVRGAGPWHTNVFTTTNHGVGFYGKAASEGGSTGVELYDFSITGYTNVRDDGQLDSGTGGAPSKSIFQNLWIEHTKCGMWLDGPFDGLHIVDTTMRNLYADGVNFHLGVTNSVVEQCNLRNLGDDGLAMWSQTTADAKNVFKFNTIQVPVLANGIAIYGGESNSATDNYVADSICDGGGLQVANRFDAIKLSGKTDFSRNTVVRCGAPSRFGSWHNGAIWIWANQGPISDVTFSNSLILDSSWAGVTFWDGTSKVAFNNVTIDGSDWAFELHSVAGQADLTNVLAKNIRVVGTASCVGGGFKLNDISGNDYPKTVKCMGW